MGSTQLLLVILSIIIVGIGVSLGVHYAGDATLSTNRYNVVNDLKMYGAKAQLYAQGNGKSFEGFTMKYIGRTDGSNNIVNANGTYAIGATHEAGRLLLTGNGTEVAENGSHVAYTLMVYPDSLASRPTEEN